MKRAFVVFALLLAASAAQAAAFKVIVNPDLNVESLSLPVLSNVFLKKVERWSNGVLIVPVDQTDGVRDEFSKAVHGKSTSAVKMYWMQQIYSGHGVPPVQKTSDEAVVAYVKSNRGAIGYVSESAATDGVRVVAISPAP